MRSEILRIHLRQIAHFSESHADCESEKMKCRVTQQMQINCVTGAANKSHFAEEKESCRHSRHAARRTNPSWRKMCHTAVELLFFVGCSSSAPARRKIAAAQINYRTRTHTREREREREERRAMPSAFVIIFGQIFAALPHLLPLDLSQPFCQIFASIYIGKRGKVYSPLAWCQWVTTG